MKTSKLYKFFTACASVVKNGQMTVSQNHCIVSHSDIANVCVGIITTDLEVQDGTYGLEFDRLYNLLGVVKSKDCEFTLTKDSTVVKFEKTKKTFPPLEVSVLPSIRPNIMEKINFPCRVEVDKNEFIDIINVIDKTTGVEKNGSIKIKVSYNGKELSIATADDPRDFVERAFEITSVETGKGDQFTSFYPFDYMKNMASVFKKIDAETLVLAFGNDMPIAFIISDEEVSLSYLLAQRVDEGE